MDAVLLGARLVLAAVFAVAGTAKVVDPGGARLGLEGFGVPGRLAARLGRVLPLAELAVALALLPRASAWWGAAAALGLLLAFTVAIGVSLARGRRPDCRCFGQLRAAPVGWWTLARNSALAALAALAVGLGHADAGPSLVDWVVPTAHADRPAVFLGLGLLGVTLLSLARLLAQQTTILARLEAIETRLEEGGPVERDDARPPDKGLPVGAPAPPFTLPDLDGHSSSLATLLERGRPVLLLLVSPGCDPCVALVPEIAAWQRDHAAASTLALVSSGSAEENRPKFGALASERVLLQVGTEVADAYAAQWTPGAVLIGRTGRIASPVAYGDQAIRTLVAHAAAAPDAPIVDLADGRRGRAPFSLIGSGPPRLGDPAPQVALPDLDGRTIDLRDYRGRDTLIIFWQPNCPHCQGLAEDLRRWEAEPPRSGPRLLVVSSESIEANRALGFQSPVVLDEGFKVGKAFGARGTPSAVLVDAEGRIASTVGVGARDVLALAGALPLIPPGRAPLR